MPASFPSSVKSWTDKQDLIDDVFAGDINGAYHEIIAIENELMQIGYKRSVRVATTQNGDLATAFANGQTVDGVVLATGDRILIKDQTNGAENGIYIVNASGAPTRATDANSSAHMVPGLMVYVREGTINGKGTWKLTTTGTITLGTTPLTFENELRSHLAEVVQDRKNPHGLYSEFSQRGVNVKWFGAVGDGIVDDTTAISDAITYATTNKTNVYFPNGSYLLTAPLVLNQSSPMLIMPDPETWLLFNLPTTTDIAITIRGNSQPYLGSIKSLKQYQNTGIRYIDINFTRQCFQKNQYFERGIEVISQNGYVYDNDITFNLIDARYAIKMETTNANYTMEGNVITFNFITEFLYGIILKRNTGAAGLFWNTIEGNVMHGTQANGFGFYFDGAPGAITANVFKIKSYMDMEYGENNGTYIGGSNSGRAEIQNCDFDLYVRPSATHKTFNITGGNEIKIRGDGPYPPVINTGLAPTTTTNSLASFNNGKPLYHNKCVFEFTIPASSPVGVKIPRYFYHQLLSRSSLVLKQIKVIPLHSSIEKFNVYAFDNSNNTPYEGIIAITPILELTVDTTVKLMIEIE